MIKLRIKKIDDEYQVQWIEDGKLDEGKTYYTNCKEDAETTLLAIREHRSFPQAQKVVIEVNNQFLYFNGREEK